MSDKAVVGARVQVTHPRLGCVGRRGTIDRLTPQRPYLIHTHGPVMYEITIDPNDERPEWPEGGLVSLKRDEFEVMPPGLEDK